MIAPAPQPPSQPAARQVHAASRAFVGLALAVTTVAACASFALSVYAQAAVGALIGLRGGLEFAVPVAVDAYIVAALMTAATLKARGQGTAAPAIGWSRLRPSGLTVQRLTLGCWTFASIALNVGHAVTTYRGSDALGMIAVASVGALMPLGILAASEGVLALAVAPSETPAVARAKANLVNAGIPVAAISTSRRPPEAQALDAVIAAALVATPTASLRGVAAELQVSVHRVRSVKERLRPNTASA
jgi:hypothetical protein